MKTVYISDEDLENSQDFYNKISDLARVEMLSLHEAKVRKPLEDEIEILRKMVELRSIKNHISGDIIINGVKFNEEQQAVLQQHLGNQEALLNFKEKYLKEERLKVIAEFETWVEQIVLGHKMEDDDWNVDSIVKKRVNQLMVILKQKLNEMKEVK